MCLAHHHLQHKQKQNTETNEWRGWTRGTWQDGRCLAKRNTVMLQLLSIGNEPMNPSSHWRTWGLLHQIWGRGAHTILGNMSYTRRRWRWFQ
jgi:hypothetical protein